MLEKIWGPTQKTWIPVFTIKISSLVVSTAIYTVFNVKKNSSHLSFFQDLLNHWIDYLILNNVLPKLAQSS